MRYGLLGGIAASVLLGHRGRPDGIPQAIEATHKLIIGLRGDGVIGHAGEDDLPWRLHLQGGRLLQVDEIAVDVGVASTGIVLPKLEEGWEDQILCLRKGPGGPAPRRRVIRRGIQAGFLVVLIIRARADPAIERPADRDNPVGFAAEGGGVFRIEAAPDIMPGIGARGPLNPTIPQRDPSTRIGPAKAAPIPPGRILMPIIGPGHRPVITARREADV
jgi:hypothetical protein